MRTEALYGRDWTELGVIGRADLSDAVALANSRGGVRKAYRYTDPNEDVVAAAALDDGRVVLVCADGHNGETASRVAVDTMLELSHRLADSDALLDAFVECNDAVLRVNAGTRNRTTLLVAVDDRERIHWAAMGDSALVMLRNGRAPVRLGDPCMHFVGFPMSPEEVAARLPRGTIERADGDALVLVTDGLEEFLHDGRTVEDVVADVASGAGSARALCDALVETAFDAGAGDNVAAVVFSP